MGSDTMNTKLSAIESNDTYFVEFNDGTAEKGKVYKLVNRCLERGRQYEEMKAQLMKENEISDELLEALKAGEPLRVPVQFCSIRERQTDRYSQEGSQCY